MGNGPEFDDRSRRNVLLAAVATGPRCQQHQQRAQAFAATINNVMGKLVDQGDIAVQAGLNEAVDGTHLVRDERADRVEVYPIFLIINNF